MTSRIAGCRALLLALVVWLRCVTVAHAQTCTGTMPNIDFGTVNTSAGSPIDLNGNLSVSCTGFATAYARTHERTNARVCSRVSAAHPGPAPTAVTFVDALSAVTSPFPTPPLPSQGERVDAARS